MERMSIVREFVAAASGTVVVLDDGNKYLVKIDKGFLFHGVKIKYTVEENVLNIIAIDYSDVIERICKIKGYSAEEAKAVKLAYANSKGYRKAFDESLKNTISSDGERNALTKLFFGYAYLRSGAEKVARYGVSWKALEEVFERFGFKTFIKLKENPFECVSLYMGFDIACEIYFEDNTDLDVCSRAISKKTVSLLKADKHTYIGGAELWDICERYKTDPRTVWEYASKIMAEEHTLDEKVLQENELIAFKDKVLAERELAVYLKKAITNRVVLVPEQKIEKFRAKLVKEGVILSSGQSMALSIAKSTGLTCLTGGPGTGKTTVVRNILRVIEENIPNTVVKLCAPTGKAAKRLSESTDREAVTVHRLLEMDHHGSCRKNERNKIDADVIVVDEASMLDTALCLKLMKALSDKCLVIFCGDVDQLPPVEAGQVFADLIRTGKLPIYRLYETMRQGEGVLLTNINKIRDFYTDMEEKTGEYETHEFESPKEASNAVLEETVRLYQEKGLMEFQLLVARHEGTMGTKLLNAQLQYLLNPNKAGTDSPFVKGDKIIFTKNNYRDGYLNGDLGIVVGQTDIGIEVEVLGGEKPIFVPIEDFKNLDLAYAITVHKSQGSEYPTVMVAFLDEDNMMLTRNWIYTAVSRAKQTCLVYKEKSVTPMGSSMRKTLLPLFM